MTMETYVMITKISANSGIKKFGEQYVVDMFKEFISSRMEKFQENKFLELSIQTDSHPEKIN